MSSKTHCCTGLYLDYQTAITIGLNKKTMHLIRYMKVCAEMGKKKRTLIEAVIQHHTFYFYSSKNNYEVCPNT